PGPEGARGDRGADVADGVGIVGLGGNGLGFQRGFEADRDLGRLGHHQMRLDVEIAQRIEQPDAVADAGGAAYPQAKPFFAFGFRNAHHVPFGFTGSQAKVEEYVTVRGESDLLSGPKTMRCTHGTARAYPGTLRKTQETGTAHSRRNGTPRLGRGPGVGTQERKASHQGRAGTLAKQRPLNFP